MNAYPRHPAVEPYLHASLDAILRRGRSDNYTVPLGDERERDVIANMLNSYAGVSAFKANDVISTTGSTEGMGLLFMVLAEQGDIDVILPLPAYFAYEVSAARWGLPIRGYYRQSDGFVVERERTGRPRTAVVVNSPESVTGLGIQIDARWSVENFAGPDGILIYDCIYQLEDAIAGGLSASHDLVQDCVSEGQLDRKVLLFTASKDLSLPGLRSGLLVTKSACLREAFSEILMERYYAGSPLPSYLMGLYFTMLNAAIGKNTGDLLWSLFDDGAPTAESSCLAVTTLADPVVVAELQQSMLNHFDRGYTRARRVLEEHGADGICLGRRPDAGYSTTLELTSRFAGAESMASQARRWLAADDIRVYPHFVFGGDEHSWHALHPSRAFIRLNVSGDHDELEAALRRVTAGIGPEPGQPKLPFVPAASPPMYREFPWP